MSCPNKLFDVAAITEEEARTKVVQKNNEDAQQ